MLSYKEYKLLNESLYGAFNLGLRSPSTVGGIVSGSSINGTEAALEAESEEAIEEAKKGKKMKKKMDSEEMEPSDEEEKKVDSDEEDHDDEDSDEDHDDEDSDEDHDDEDSDEEDHDDEDSDEGEEAKDEKPMFMKKNSRKHMKKKSKKEWSEVMSDLEEILEEVSDEDALQEIKKGLETIKEGFKKGHMKNHKKGCDCKLCKNKEEKEDGDDDEGLTDAQKKLPESLRKAILAKKGKKKDDGDDKKCGKMMGKKCGKYMNEDEAAWWNSVNNMLGANPEQKNWDGMWSEVGEVQQAVREGEQIDEGILQDIGNSKFVRNAVTAAGLGAAALGGYGLKGMQGNKAGAEAPGGRAVAMATQDDGTHALPNFTLKANKHGNSDLVPADAAYLKSKGMFGKIDKDTIVMRGMEGGKEVSTSVSVEELRDWLKENGHPDSAWADIWASQHGSTAVHGTEGGINTVNFR